MSQAGGRRARSPWGSWRGGSQGRPVHPPPSASALGLRPACCLRCGCTGCVLGLRLKPGGQARALRLLSGFWEHRLPLSVIHSLCFRFWVSVRTPCLASVFSSRSFFQAGCRFACSPAALPSAPCRPPGHTHAGTAGQPHSKRVRCVCISPWLEAAREWILRTGEDGIVRFQGQMLILLLQ